MVIIVIFPLPLYIPISHIMTAALYTFFSLHCRCSLSKRALACGKNGGPQTTIPKAYLGSFGDSAPFCLRKITWHQTLGMRIPTISSRTQPYVDVLFMLNIMIFGHRAQSSNSDLTSGD